MTRSRSLYGTIDFVKALSENGILIRDAAVGYKQFVGGLLGRIRAGPMQRSQGHRLDRGCVDQLYLEPGHKVGNRLAWVPKSLYGAVFHQTLRAIQEVTSPDQVR